MPLLPRPLSAVPILRGLEVDASPADSQDANRRVYPWHLVSQQWSRNHVKPWKVYRENGTELTEENRRGTLTVSGCRANRVALAAQSRALRRSWNAGDFHLTETYATGFGTWCIIPFVAVIFFGWGMIACLTEAWPATASMPTNGLTEDLAVAILFVALLAMLCVAPVLWFSYRFATRPNVAQAEYTCDGLRARLRDGRDVAAQWEDLQDIRCAKALARMSFRNGVTLWFAAAYSRTELTHRLVKDQFLPRPTPPNPNRARNVRIAVGTCFAVAAVGVGWLRYHVAPPAEGPWLAAPLAILAIGALALLVVPAARRIDRAARRCRKRLGPRPKRV